MFYSSGTTGLSKGVEITHNGINTVLEMCRAGYRHFFPERDVLLAVLPFFHVQVSLKFHARFLLSTLARSRLLPINF